MKNPVYLPIAINFVISLLNNMYGFLCGKKRELSAD